MAARCPCASRASTTSPRARAIFTAETRRSEGSLQELVDANADAIAEGVADDSRAAAVRPLRVLVVTDNRDAADTLARILRGLHDGLTLVAPTGWGTASYQRRSRDAGFEHHLVKPISSGRVLEPLAHVAAR